MKRLTLNLSVLILSFCAFPLQSFSQQNLDTITTPSFNLLVKSEAFNQGHIVEPLQLISGQAPGASISRKGSDPNFYSNISIRGISSMFSPGTLFIVDGVVGANPNMISPNDIESFEILKDAISTAEYGSRGVDGVVIIKTKGNNSDKRISVDFNSYLSQNYVSKRMDLLSASDYRGFVNSANLELAFEDGGYSTDWQDEIFRSTFSHTHSLAVFGKVNTTNYRVSAYHQTNPGVVLGTSSAKNGVSLNLSQIAFSKRLIISGSASAFSNEGNQLPNYYGNQRENILYQAFTRNPSDPIYESNGKTYSQPLRAFNYHNPLAIIDYHTVSSNSRSLSLSLNADFEIAKDLILYVNSGYSIFDNENRQFEDTEMAYDLGNYFVSEIVINDNERFNVKSGFRFSKTIGQDHHLNINAFFSHSFTSDEFKSSRIVDNNDPDIENNETDIYNFLDKKYSSIIGKLHYSYKHRYFLSGLINNEFYSITGDYTYTFNNSAYLIPGNPVEHKNLFPSLRLGWNLHNEQFIKGLDFISTLTFQGGYGVTGSNKYNETLFFSSYHEPGKVETEKTQELSIRLDYGFLNNRLRGWITYFDRTTSNGVFIRPLPFPSGIPYTYENGIRVENKGIEASLGAIVISNERLKWNSNLILFTNKNLYTNDNLLPSSYGLGGYISYHTSSQYTQISKTGNPLIAFYLPVYAGISPSGYPAYYNENGNITTDYISAKKEIMGQIWPKYEIGWTNTFSMAKGVDLSFAIRYVAGHSIYNATRMYLANPSFLPTTNTINEAVYNYNDGLQTTRISDLYLEDASYLRLDNIIIGYTHKLNRASWKADAKFYIGANNLITITKYKGQDPSVGSDNGIDYFNVYSLARSFVFGLKLSI